jgi:DNA-binding response OmpR family regulator
MARRILLVEDEIAILEGLAALLEYELPDVEIVAASDAAAAIRRLASGETFHLIVTDWDLWPHTGKDVLTAVRDCDRLHGGAKTPVLLLSGARRDATGFDAFINAATDPGTIIDVIRRHLDSGPALP